MLDMCAEVVGAEMEQQLAAAEPSAGPEPVPAAGPMTALLAAGQASPGWHGPPSDWEDDYGQQIMGSPAAAPLASLHH
jgi:hypothetical protein